MVCPSPLGWLGGKTKLRKTIISCFPKHKAYIEIFGGSGTVFFGKPPELSKIEIINDVHGELVNLMKVISGTYFDETVRQEFISYVRNMPAARSAFEEWKKWKPDRLDQLSPAARAFRFYYCVKKGFSSTPTGGYEASPLSKSRYNMNTDFDQFADRFRATNAQIENMDFRKLIEKYNKTGAKAIFYIDPPYWIANNTNYYEFVFTEIDHQDLRDACDDITTNGNYFLISYDDVDTIIDLYDGCYIYRTDPVSYNAAEEHGSRKTSKSELFITNYDIGQFIAGGRDMFKETISSKRIDFVDCVGIERIKPN